MNVRELKIVAGASNWNRSLAIAANDHGLLPAVDLKSFPAEPHNKFIFIYRRGQ
jgi:hypothetical protein